MKQKKTYVPSTLSVYMGMDGGGTGMGFQSGVIVDYKSRVNGLSSKIYYNFSKDLDRHNFNIMFNYNGILYNPDIELDGAEFSDQNEAIEWAKHIFDGYI